MPLVLAVVLLLLLRDAPAIGGGLLLELVLGLRWCKREWWMWHEKEWGKRRERV
jgi:hypothetical protein